MKEDSLGATLCFVAHLLKNRPLKADKRDVEDLEALTPNHFLVGNLNLTFDVTFEFNI